MARRAAAGTVQRIRQYLPHGRSLPADVWWQRHRGILALLWAHVPVLFVIAQVRDPGWAHAFFESGLIAGLAVIATAAKQHPGLRTVVTSVGLMTCSAELVHLSDGLIEMHFHFFVMVGVVTLYQEWRPFLVAIGYVVLHHGFASVVDPASVYNHAAAINGPWKWAAVHGGFILGMSLTGIITWKLNELLIEATARREQQLAEAQQIARVGSWEYRADVGYASWSEEMYRLLGVDESFDTIGGSVAPLIHPEDRAAWQADMDRASSGVARHDLEFRVLRPDGTERWVHGRGQVTQWNGTEAAVMTGTVQDVTERRQSDDALRSNQHELREALSLLHATLDSTADGILVVDVDGHIAGYNGRFAEMWSLPPYDLIDSDHTGLMADLLDQLENPGSLMAGGAQMSDRAANGRHETVVFNDGRVVEQLSLPQRVDGQIVGHVWSFRDVTDRSRLERELAHQAFHDSLTGLANQALFRDRLDHALARLERGTGSELAVLFLDLDNFKYINDSLGHSAGDRLLLAVTERLTSRLRPADTAARLGGDEFAVLLEDLTGFDEAEEVAGRLLSALREPISVADKEVFTTASIGIAAHTPGVANDQLLRNADLAMYAAKRRGKNRYERFAPEMHLAAIERIEIEGDLRHACERDELRLHYQPIVSIETGELLGVEALVRWQHPERGLLPPSAFIPFAEDSDMIDVIGRWVLAEACHQARRWHVLCPDRAPIGVAVNVSPRQLRNPDIAQEVADTLREAELAPECLTLEITEGAMMHDTDLSLARLRELKSLGVRLAIDDFGTGYSSLSYLQQFPIDVLKIDRSFVDRIEDGVEASALARAIVRLAQSMQLSAVAEGVENAAQIDWLRDVGCPSAQGFHLSHPVAADQIDGLLQGGTAFSVATDVSVGGPSDDLDPEPSSQGLPTALFRAR